MIRTAVLVLVVLGVLFAASQLLPKFPGIWEKPPGGDGVSVVPPPLPPPPPPPEPDPTEDGRLEVVVTGKGYEVDGKAITLTELKALLEKTRDTTPEHERIVRLFYTKDSRMFPRDDIEQLIKQSGLECVLEKKN